MTLDELEAFIVQVDDHLPTLVVALRIEMRHKIAVVMVPFDVRRDHWRASRHWKLNFRVELCNLHVDALLKDSGIQVKLIRKFS